MSDEREPENPAAFPTLGDDWTAPGPGGVVRQKGEYGWAGERGMSLRDWFAGQALAGLLANPDPAELEQVVPRAYEYADAMLAERERKSK